MSGNDALAAEAVRESDIRPARATSGCWVHIFEDEDFSTGDDHLVVWGPASFANMRGLPSSGDKDWGDEIDSVIVGPNAWVQAFEDENFEDTEIWFVPNQAVRSLDELGIGDDIDSMRIYDHPPTRFMQWLRTKTGKAQTLRPDGHGFNALSIERNDKMRDELKVSQKDLIRKLSQSRAFDIKYTAWIEGHATIRIQILDSSQAPRIVRCEQVISNNACVVSFIGDPESLDEILIKNDGGQDDVVLVWFYCNETVQGDSLAYAMVEGSSALFRARAWRGEENPGSVFQQVVTDNFEHSVQLQIPSP
jgi:hypothetical protein